MAASHGTRKMLDLEIEKVYGRGRKKHVAFDYATHLHVSTEYRVQLTYSLCWSRINKGLKLFSTAGLSGQKAIIDFQSSIFHINEGRMTSSRHHMSLFPGFKYFLLASAAIR